MTPPSRDATGPERAPSVLAVLLPVVLAVFIVFLVTGLAMPVLPLHVHQRLGFDTFVVGLVAGAQFGAALLSRFWAGRYADTRGASRAVVVGLGTGATAGLLYLLSLQFLHRPLIAVSVLLAGRAVFGAAESIIVTGALGWGLALVGVQQAGRVMSWVGTAMYVAFAVGAPAGTALHARFGFASIAWATTLIPLAALPVVLAQPSAAGSRDAPPAVRRVLRAVAMPGLGLALSCVAFGALTTFVTLLFVQRGWSHAWLAFTVLSVAFTVTRLFLGALPDRMGGARVALVSVLIEAAGQALVWLAPSVAWALAGAGLTGVGYAMVYPAFGVEAVRRAPPEARSLALGAYSAFLDLALGLASPALGLVASHAGLGSVFLVSALVVSSAALVAVRLMATPVHGLAPASRPSSATSPGGSTP